MELSAWTWQGAVRTKAAKKIEIEKGIRKQRDRDGQRGTERQTDARASK